MTDLYALCALIAGLIFLVAGAAVLTHRRDKRRVGALTRWEDGR